MKFFEFTKSDYDYFVKEGMLETPYKVIDVARKYKNNIVLCTMRGHITCIKGKIYDTFDPSDRIVEDVWIVE